jgi:hypothetical protein
LQGEQSNEISTTRGFFLAGLNHSHQQRPHEMADLRKNRQRLAAVPTANLVKIPNRSVSTLCRLRDYEPTTPATIPISQRPSISRIAPVTLPSNTFPRPYAVFSSNRGPKAGRPELWQHLVHVPRRIRRQRAFKTDYEIYDQRAADPDNAQIDVYIGLR